MNSVKIIKKIIHIICGEIIYNLRNNTLHAGTFDIDGKKQDIQNFELLVSNPKSARALLSYASVMKYYKNGQEFRGDRYLCINVVYLIIKICNAAKYYYKQNKEKFEFMNNRIVTVDRETIKSWGIKDLSFREKYLSYSNSYTLDKDKTKMPALLEDEEFLIVKFKN